MPQTPRYRTLDRASSVDTIVLDEFGGRVDDAAAAWIRVNGRASILVVAPAEQRTTWPEEVENRFRELVRLVASSRHPLLENATRISIVFDPPDMGTDNGTVPDDELVEL